MRPGLSALAGALLIIGLASGARAQSAAERAMDFLESGEARKAVALLAAAARTNPEDRMVGSLLYSTLRDRLWHLPHCPPIIHEAPVRKIAFSADGAWLAAGSDLGRVTVSSTDPTESAVLEFQHAGEIVGLAFSADGKLLAVAAAESGLRIWDLQTRQPVLVTPKPAKPISAFAVSADGQRVAVGLADGTGQIVSFAGNRAVAIRHARRIEALQFSPDGMKLASGSADQTARGWNALTGQPLGPAIAHRGAVLSVDFGYDGRYLLSGSADQTAVLSDPASGRPVMKPSACGAPVIKVQISPDGSQFFTLLDDHSVRIWDSYTGQPTEVALREDADFNDACWSKSGLRLLTGSASGHATVWSAHDGLPFGESLPHNGPVLATVFGPGSRLAATASSDGTVRIWRTDEGKAMPTVRFHTGHVRTAFYSGSGDLLITASEAHTVLRWRSGQLRPEGLPLKHPAPVTCAAINSEETRILTACANGQVQLWDAESGEKVGAPIQHEAPVEWVDFHPKGQLFVAAAGSAALVWDPTAPGKPVATLASAGESGRLHSARFSPNGQWVATASDEGILRIWDATTWQPVAPPIRREAAVRCARFSPDSQRLVFTGDDQHVVVLDTATWEPVAKPIVLPGAGRSVALTDNNRFVIATGILLNGARCFDIATGRSLGEGYVTDGEVTCVDYMPADKVIVLATEDGTVRSIDSPFVDQNVPSWMPDFAQRVAGLEEKTPGQFTRVESDWSQFERYVFGGARAVNADFVRLDRWLLTSGTERNGMPRFSSTIATHIEHRVEERSVAILHECYDAAPGHPLILAALSLYTPNRRQSEFLADYVLAKREITPLAQIYAAAALVNAGRSGDAEATMALALAAAPDDLRVVRRQAKIKARLQQFDAAVAGFSRALDSQPNDFETLRSYAWALYNMGAPGTALTYFRTAHSNEGVADPDIIAGMCLSADAWGFHAEAAASYQQLIALDPAWRESAYVEALSGWTALEIAALQRLRIAAVEK